MLHANLYVSYIYSAVHMISMSNIQDLLNPETTVSPTTSQNPQTTVHTKPTTTTTTTTTIIPTTRKTSTTTTTTTPPPTTSTTTTTTTTTTTPPPTTSTTTTLTPPPTVPMCHTCTGVNCSRADLQECNTGATYCMNTMTQDQNGIRTITRG